MYQEYSEHDPIHLPAEVVCKPAEFSFDFSTQKIATVVRGTQIVACNGNNIS